MSIATVNPHRSQALTDLLQSLPTSSKNDPQVTPSFCQTAAKMHSLGNIVGVIGLILAAVTIAGVVYYTRPAYYDKMMVKHIAIAGGSTSGCCLLFGMVVLNKPYWQDPVYKQGERETALQTLIDRGCESSKQWKKWNEQKLVTDAEIGAVLKKHHIQGRRYIDFHKDPKVNFYENVAKGILNRKTFEALLLEETRKHTVSQIIQQYGWKPFEGFDAILDGNAKIDGKSISQRFTEEIRGVQRFSTIFNNYGENECWKLVFGGTGSITTKPKLKRLLLADLNADTTNFFNTYHFAPFTHHILEANDSHVQSAMASHLSRCVFTDFYKKSAGLYYENCARYKLIPEAWKTDGGVLRLRYDRALDDYQHAIAEADREYSQTLANAQTDKSSATLGTALVSDVTTFHAVSHPGVANAMVAVGANLAHASIQRQAEERYRAVTQRAELNRQNTKALAMATLRSEEDQINKEWGRIVSSITPVRDDLTQEIPSAPPDEA